MTDPKELFRRTPIQRLVQMRMAYEFQLSRESDSNAKFGKMPWMIPAWTKGLNAVNEVITEMRTLSTPIQPTLFE